MLKRAKTKREQITNKQRKNKRKKHNQSRRSDPQKSLKKSTHAENVKALKTTLKRAKTKREQITNSQRKNKRKKKRQKRKWAALCLNRRLPRIYIAPMSVTRRFISSAPMSGTHVETTPTGATNFYTPTQRKTSEFDDKNDSCTKLENNESKGKRSSKRARRIPEKSRRKKD